VWISSKIPRTSTRTSIFVFLVFTLFLILYYYSIRIIIITFPTKRQTFFTNRVFSFGTIFIKYKKLRMQQDTIWTVLITLIGVLGGGSAWRYYEKRAMRKERDEEFIRHDCKDRIAKLEALLQAASKEKDEMRQTILKLTEQVSALTVKVEFLQSGKVN
jgi:hypothetical protein